MPLVSSENFETFEFRNFEFKNIFFNSKFLYIIQIDERLSQLKCQQMKKKENTALKMGLTNAVKL